MTDTQTSEQLYKFKLNIKDATEKLISTEIPKKIDTLNKLVESFEVIDDFSMVHHHRTIHVPAPRKRRGLFMKTRGSSGVQMLFGGGSGSSAGSSYQDLGARLNFQQGTLVSVVERYKPIATNVKVKDLLLKVKPLIQSLLQDTITLKMWMSFIMPKLSASGINETIKQTVMCEIELIEEYAMCLFEITSLYFVSRANSVAKVSVFPDIEDYRSAVKEFDEQSYRSMCKRISQILHCYCLLHDVISKNIDRLTEQIEPNMSI